MKEVYYINHFLQYRKLIAGIDTKIPLSNGKYTTAINFDNAATTPPLLPVLEEIIRFSPWYASVHRGAGYKSQYSSMLYEEARSIIARFVGADLKHDTVIFVKNTTEAINKLSNRLLDSHQEGIVLSSFMEHHSNDLPWRKNYTVDYIDIDKDGRLSIEDLEKKLIYYDGKVKLVAITGASNVTGYTNPIYHVAALAHKYGAEILVDGAQLVPHAPMDMKPSNHHQHIDYLVFSGHKMYAPFGVGVLIGPKKTFQKGAPDSPGGGTVELVTHEKVLWQEPPLKEESGTPNMMGVIAITAAIKVLERIGMEKIEAYERDLTNYTLQQLDPLPYIQVYGRPHQQHQRISIISFAIEGIPHHIVATILSQEAGIAVRNGCFCAQPYIQRLLNVSPEEIQNRLEDPTLPHPGLVRLSYGFYNTHAEIDVLINLLRRVISNKEFYMAKYGGST